MACAITSFRRSSCEEPYQMWAWRSDQQTPEKVSSTYANSSQQQPYYDSLRNTAAVGKVKWLRFSSHGSICWFLAFVICIARISIAELFRGRKFRADQLFFNSSTAIVCVLRHLVYVKQLLEIHSTIERMDNFSDVWSLQWLLDNLDQCSFKEPDRKGERKACI